MNQIKKLVERPFFKSLGVYAVSSYLNKVIPFLMLPILTSYLNTEEYGEVSMFNALTSILTAVCSWSIDGALLRKYYESRSRLANIFFNYISIVCVSFAGGFLLLILLQNLIEKHMGVRAVYLAPAVLYSFFSVLCSCINNLYQAKGKAFKYGIFTNTWSFANAMLSVLFVAGMGLGVAGRIGGITVSTVLSGLFAMAFLVKEAGFEPGLDAGVIKEELAVFGIPSLPMNLRGTVLSLTDRIFIAGMVSVSAAGVYTVGNQIALVADVFVRSVSLAFTPWVYGKLEKNDEGSNRKVVKLTLLLFGLIASVSVFWLVLSSVGIGRLLRQEYWEARYYAAWLIAGKAFMGFQLLIVNFIYFYKQTKEYALISSASILLNILLNYWMITAKGSIGAAAATFIVYAVTFTATLVLAVAILKNRGVICKKGNR